MSQQSTESEPTSRSNSRILSDSRFVSVIFIALVAGLGTNVAAATLPSITDALAVSSARVGLIVTMYTLPAMFMVPVSGVIADMYGRRTIVLPSLLLYGIAGGAIALVETFDMILFLRAAQGIAVAGMMPITVTLIGDLYSGPTGSKAQGLRVAAMGMNSIATPVVAGFLSGIVWSYPFLLYLLALPVTALVYAYLPETTSGVDHRSGIAPTLKRYGRSLGDELADTNIVVLSSGGFARDFVRYGLLTFVPLFAVQTFDASYVVAGSILSIRGGAQILVSPMSGRIVALSSKKYALLAAMSVSAVSVSLIAFVPSILWLGVLYGLYSIGDALFSPVIKDTLTGATVDHHRGSVVSSMTMLSYAGQTLAPVAFGAVLAFFGFTAIFLIGAGVAVVYAIAFYLLVDLDRQ